MRSSYGRMAVGNDMDSLCWFMSGIATFRLPWFLLRMVTRRLDAMKHFCFKLLIIQAKILATNYSLKIRNKHNIGSAGAIFWVNKIHCKELYCLFVISLLLSTYCSVWALFNFDGRSLLLARIEPGIISKKRPLNWCLKPHLNSFPHLIW